MGAFPNGTDASIRVAVINYDAHGGYTIETDWAQPWTINQGVRTGQIAITAKFNAMVKGPQDHMYVFLMQVKGSGVLYECKLNLLTDF
jgi:hypothetical protein